MSTAFCRWQGVSIRAPARGATRPEGTKNKRASCFNPRSREGSDLKAGAMPALTRGFNPRSREGSDLRILEKCRHCGCFNPRSREGSDQTPTLFQEHPGKFQSALPRGERHTFSLIFHPVFCFNPRSREGSDHRTVRLVRPR